MENIRPGISRDICNQDCHSEPCLGSSQLCELARSPLHYSTQKLGTATHCPILEPERFEVEYICAPAINIFALTNINRAWKFATLLSDAAIITDTFRNNPAYCLITLDMANSMKRNPMVL